MINKLESSQNSFNARLTNVEYYQVALKGDFLRNLSSIIQLLQPRLAATSLIRLGCQGDGGYVIASVFDSKICLNLGVGDEVSSDLDLLHRGFKIYAIDGTVTNPLPEESKYIFIAKNIGYTKSNESTTDLKTIFREHPDLEKVDLVLLDIEGWEYKVFQEELEFIAKTKQLVVEFHGLELIADYEFSEQFIDILKRLSKTHKPIHVHANNSGGTLPIGGASWPTILEVTFLMNELCTSEISHGPFPSAIDFPNVDVRPDVDLSPFFGQSRSYASLVRTILDLD
jgi:FkbM family methyltransferase